MNTNDRRDILKLGAAAFTTAIFTGNVKGANDRIRVSFIGTGRQGQGNMGSAMAHPEVEIASVCDVYQPNLEKAQARSARGANNESGARTPAKGVKDFREVLADKSVDAVCIATPDHWHAYMTVEACKAGKDVYVEKPASVTIEEGRKMVQAARKYDRVVQVGTQQRSGVHFQKATKLVHDGIIGKVTFIRTFNYGNAAPEGRYRHSPRLRASHRPRLADVAGARARAAVQQEPLRRGPECVFAFSLVLGLRGRHDDRLGRTRSRHCADGLR
ncbi:MAG: oxidoreductase domain protein [Bryobacterales bacterium]|nr:oxidoreductase domain protein [Bryobacterales bacterium]